MAAVYIVMANALVDGERLPTLFLVDRELPGIEVVDDPPFSHTYPHGHPTIRFTGVEVLDDAVIGPVGRRRRTPALLVHRGAARHRGPRRRARCGA